MAVPYSPYQTFKILRTLLLNNAQLFQPEYLQLALDDLTNAYEQGNIGLCVQPALSSAFNWANTQMGTLFWSHVHNTLLQNNAYAVIDPDPEIFQSPWKNTLKAAHEDTDEREVI